MRPATTCLIFLILTLVLLVSFGVATASGQEFLWENRGQPEFFGFVLDIAGGGRVVVTAGSVAGELGDEQWFVRAVDRRTGATKWEDRFGAVIFGEARDVAIEGRRAFVAGFILTPGRGFEFVVRAYDISSGVVLWSQEVSRGPQCGEERPGFAACVAKALAVHDGRVFVVGHLTRTAARSDFAVLAFDAATGTPLWESVTDSSGTGARDFAWAVSAKGDSVFVLGEIGPFSGLVLQAHDARTGAIRWQQQVPGATNFFLKDTLAWISTDRNSPKIPAPRGQCLTS